MFYGRGRKNREIQRRGGCRKLKRNTMGRVVEKTTLTSLQTGGGGDETVKRPRKVGTYQRELTFSANIYDNRQNRGGGESLVTN